MCAVTVAEARKCKICALVSDESLASFLGGRQKHTSGCKWEKIAKFAPLPGGHPHGNCIYLPMQAKPT